MIKLVGTIALTIFLRNWTQNVVEDLVTVYFVTSQEYLLTTGNFVYHSHTPQVTWILCRLAQWHTVTGKIDKTWQSARSDACLRPSWGTDSRSTSKEFSRRVWNSKIHYHNHKSLPPPQKIYTKPSPYFHSFITHFKIMLPSMLTSSKMVILF
jgi:hypothetical protein